MPPQYPAVSSIKDDQPNLLLRHRLSHRGRCWRQDQPASLAGQGGVLWADLAGTLGHSQGNVADAGKAGLVNGLAGLAAWQAEGDGEEGGVKADDGGELEEACFHSGIG